MRLVLGSWDVILDETALVSVYILQPNLFFSLASSLLREISLFTIRTLILLLFRVSTNYRYPFYHFTNAFPPILVLPFILLFFFTKLFSRFLCVLVVLLLGRGWSHWLFITVFLRYLVCRLYLQMAVYVIGGSCG